LWMILFWAVLIFEEESSRARLCYF
jgi:hypothetical protein